MSQHDFEIDASSNEDADILDSTLPVHSSSTADLQQQQQQQPASSTTSRSSAPLPPRQVSVYVAYPRPVGPSTGIETTPLLPATVGRHNGFLRTYKLLIVGEAGVGKSNLMHRYCNGAYDPALPSTIGTEFYSRQVDIPSGAVGATETVVLQLWDTAGQERSTGLISNAFYRNAVGAIVVYDVTRRESLLNVPRWVARVTELASDDCVCVVVGAKVDLLDGAARRRSESTAGDDRSSSRETDLKRQEWETLQQEADRISHAMGLRNFFTSALSGEGVLEVFTHLVLAVDAVQAAPSLENSGDRYSALRQQRHLTGTQMWTPASTVPASPIGVLGGGGTAAASSRQWTASEEPADNGGGGGSRPGAPAQLLPVPLSSSPGMTPSTSSGYMSPVGSVSPGQWRTPSSSPSKQKKTIDLRGFGPDGSNGGTGPGGAAPAGGFSESSYCGC